MDTAATLSYARPTIVASTGDEGRWQSELTILSYIGATTNVYEDLATGLAKITVEVESPSDQTAFWRRLFPQQPQANVSSDFVSYLTAQMPFSNEIGAFQIVGNVALVQTSTFQGRIDLTFTSPVRRINSPIKTAASKLIDLITSKRAAAEIEQGSAGVANAAVNDAKMVFQRANVGGAPHVMFSEDGILSLQWQRGEFGVALIFAGDGTVSIAFSRPGQLYAENGIEIAVSEDLPAEFTEALSLAK